MKLSGPAAIAIAVVALLAVVAAGYYYIRQASGAAIADDVRAATMKQKSGPPVSAAQIETMKKANTGAANAPR